jgi:hypothetical protein
MWHGGKDRWQEATLLLLGQKGNSYGCMKLAGLAQLKYTPDFASPTYILTPGLSGHYLKFFGRKVKSQQGSFKLCCCIRHTKKATNTHKKSHHLQLGSRQPLQPWGLACGRE